MTLRVDLSHSDSFESPIEREKPPELILPVLKSFHVQPVSQQSLLEKNVVLLSSSDYKDLFGEKTPDLPKYIQIANQVFRVALANIAQGRIGMSEAQMDSVDEGIYPTSHYRGVTVSPYDLSDHTPFAIGKLEIEIDDHESLLNDDHQTTLSVSDIQRQIRKVLRDEVITRNKTLFLKLPQGTFKAKIHAIHPFSETKLTDSTSGILLPNTELAIIPRLSPLVVLTDKIFREEVERVDFQLTISKRSQFATYNTHPLPLSREEIEREIRKKFENSVIAQGAEFIIHHPSGWDITVKFKEGIVNEGKGAKHDLPPIDYSTGYVISKKTPIKITKPWNILLSEGEPKPAQKITFKISDMPGPGLQKVDIDHSKELWISLEELKHEIQSLDRSFVVGEIFEVALSSGSFYIEVNKAQGITVEEELRSAETEPLWSLEDDTEIQFTVEKELKLNMIKDHSVHPVKRAFIQLKAEKIPDEGLRITLEQLKKLVVAQAPRRLVDNHTFSVKTEDGDKLEVKVNRAVFDKSIGKTEEISAFGALSAETKIDFSTAQSDKITLVEKVHSDDLKAMRFSMRVTEQSDASRRDRPPIVVERTKLSRLIRKELAKHPYITEGFSKTFDLENGWNIEITFRKGILEKKERHSDQQSVRSSKSHKDAYAIQEETEILLVGGNGLVLLSQGVPVEAGRAHLEVIDVKEDYTTQDTLLEKGAWINTEELKRELLANSRPLVIGEKILIELDSGKYIIEVKSMKADNPKATLPKKRKEAAWKLSADTKVNVTVGAGADLIAVSDETVYPLEKIKFITYPSSVTEHISIKEEEIKEALMEDLPERLIQGQILEIETKSNHTLHIEVKEVKLKDEPSSIDKKKIFTAITSETEVLFRGKEKTSIAIRSEPKVLEVEDPIAYLEDLGMAGLDKEFKQVFRIFYSRSDRLIEEARRRGTKPIKGILLYGPPGTGKTTLARHVGEMLGCSGERLQLITATEMFNMWFGQSEENIRKLFEPARDALRKYGDKSPLYIVIIDEIDALLPQRGGSVNKVRDSLVNQFLGEIDGLNELNNLLVIGLTNRREEIDPAALRHGRLGVHIEIGLPDKKARNKIFEVHTRQLVKEGLLHDNVDLEALAEMTDKLPGAAIEGIVESASLFSLARLSKLKCSKEELRVHPDGLIRMEDFEKALKEQSKEKEIPESIRRMYL